MVPRATLLRTQVVTFTYEEANASHWYPPCLAVWFGARGTFPPLGNGTGRADRWARGRCVWDQRGDSTASSFTLRRRRGWDRCQTRSGHRYPEVKRDTDRSVPWGGGEAGSLGDARVWQLRTPARTLGRARDCTLGTATWPELGRKHPERAGRQVRCTRRGPPSIWGPGSSAVSLSPRLHLEHNPEATQSGNQAEEISPLRSEWAGPGNVPRAFHPGLTHRAMWPAPHGKDRGEATGQSGPPAPPVPRSGERVQGPRPRGRRSLKLCCQCVPGGNAGQGEPHGAPAELRSPVFHEQSNDAPRPSWDQPMSSVSPPPVTTAKRDESVL